MAFEDVNLEHVRKALAHFAEERDWGRFHTPKNLAAALTVEAGELLELFQWHADGEDVAYAATEAGAARIREEVADIALYLIRLADVAGVDLRQALDEKLVSNADRYPVALAHGRATKYDQL